MDLKSLTYQCFFVDRWNWLRSGFISINSGAFGAFEEGVKLPKPSPGAEARVAVMGLPKGSPDTAISKAVKSVADAATDFSWLHKGDRVLIKPANNSGEKYPATTHPAGITGMVETLKARGAGKVIVSDMAGIEHVKLTPTQLCGSTRLMMERNGILQATQAAGAKIYLPEEEGWGAFFEDGPVSGSHWKNGIMVPKILKEIDHIVLMPRTSRHPLGGATLGLKAAVGYVRFDSRLEYHRDASSYYEKHVEINTVPSIKDKLRLVLTVATKAQTTFGPDEGYEAEPGTGLIFASESIVAHDMVSLAWLEREREETPAEVKRGIKDPYGTNSTVVSILNGGVVFLLGGVTEATRSEKLKKYALDASIWNDPTLHRAFEIWGGAPVVNLEDAFGSVPENMIKELKQRITL